MGLESFREAITDYTGRSRGDAETDDNHRHEKYCC